MPASGIQEDAYREQGLLSTKQGIINTKLAFGKLIICIPCHARRVTLRLTVFISEFYLFTLVVKYFVWVKLIREFV